MHSLMKVCPFVIVSETKMFFQVKRLDVTCLTKFIKQELQQQETDVKFLKDFLSRLSPDTNKLAMDSLINDSSLNDDEFLDFLNLYLDEKTKHFILRREPKSHKTSISILQIIPKLSPKIETIDFSRISFSSLLKEELINFLKKCKNLKTLNVCSNSNKCALWKLLIDDDFAELDQNVQSGLEKIEYFKLTHNIKPKECTKLLRRLPNLNSFGKYQHRLSFVLSDYFNRYKLNIKTLNLTVIYDIETTNQTLDIFAKFCPKLTMISILKPRENVVENLWKFPLLSEIELFLYDGIELENFLKKSGKEIRKLRLFLTQCNHEFILSETFYDLCPKLIELTNIIT